MPRRILIAFASGTGSTGEIAEAIAEVLRDEQNEVTVLPAAEARDVDTYNVVIAGSSIRAGRWLRPATDFVKNNAAVLLDIPVALFSVGISMREDSAENRARAASHMAKLAETVRPVDTGVFAGAHDPEKLAFVPRLITRLAKIPAGDFRDWDAIRAWTEDLKVRLDEPRPEN